MNRFEDEEDKLQDSDFDEIEGMLTDEERQKYQKHLDKYQPGTPEIDQTIWNSLRRLYIQPGFDRWTKRKGGE